MMNDAFWSSLFGLAEMEDKDKDKEREASLLRVHELLSDSKSISSANPNSNESLSSLGASQLLTAFSK